MKESTLHRRIIRDLKQQFPGIWIRKIHADEYTGEGWPDILACIFGLFCMFEVKRPDAKPRNDRSERFQTLTIENVLAAGGCAAQVRSTADCLHELAKFGIEP